MRIKLIAMSWKTVTMIVLLNFLILITIVTTLVRKELKYMDSIDTTTMLQVNIRNIQEMINFTLKSAVKNLNITKEPGINEVSIYFDEIDLSQPSNLRRPEGMQIGIYYKKMFAGKKVVKLIFGSNFTKKVHFKGGANSFVSTVNSVQNKYQHLLRSDNFFKGYAYSDMELEILKSYIPLLTVLHQETIYSTSEVLDVLKQIAPWGSKTQTRLLEVLHKSQLAAKTSIVSWPLSFVDYVLLKHLYRVYWLNSLRLSKIVFIWLIVANLLLIAWLHFYRRSFWDLLSEELLKQGLSLNFRTLYALTKSNLKLILLPRRVEIIKDALKEECLRLKEEKERETICKKAGSIFQEIKNFLDVTDSHFGIIGNYYTVAIDSKTDINRSWRNLIRLESQLRNIYLRQECSSQVVPKELSPIVKFKRSSRRCDLVEDVIALLPSSCGLDLSSWSENNLNCLSRALIILPGIHKKAVSQLLRRKDLKNLMLRRNPFIKAIETTNREIVLNRLNINVEKEQKKGGSIRLDHSQLLQGLQVIVIGTGRTVNKRERFKEILTDLGARSTKFIDAVNLTRVKSAARAAKNHDNTLILLMKNHISHKASGEMAHVPKTVYIRSLVSRQFKREVIKAYSRLTKE
jgi:hypothetical protein